MTPTSSEPLRICECRPAAFAATTEETAAGFVTHLSLDCGPYDRVPLAVVVESRERWRPTFTILDDEFASVSGGWTRGETSSVPLHVFQDILYIYASDYAEARRARVEANAFARAATMRPFLQCIKRLGFRRRESGKVDVYRKDLCRRADVWVDEQHRLVMELYTDASLHLTIRTLGNQIESAAFADDKAGDPSIEPCDVLMAVEDWGAWTEES